MIAGNGELSAYPRLMADLYRPLRILYRSNQVALNRAAAAAVAQESTPR